VTERSPDETDRKVLPESLATRVLERAVELDQMRTAGSSVADLRSAAAEAGISAGAFDAALAELEHGDRVPAPAAPKRKPKRVRLSVIAGTVAVLVGFFAFMRTVPEPVQVPAEPMNEEAIVLRCLTPTEAAEVIRPLAQLYPNIVLRTAESSRVLTIRATEKQLQQIKALLDQHEAPGSTACATRPATPGTR
jgi:hypothetical protein